MKRDCYKFLREIPQKISYVIRSQSCFKALRLSSNTYIIYYIFYYSIYTCSENIEMGQISGKWYISQK